MMGHKLVDLSEEWLLILIDIATLLMIIMLILNINNDNDK